MSKNTLYILPSSEDYTGYTTSVLTGTCTSALEDYSFEGASFFPEISGFEDDLMTEDILFPETREEHFLDEDLARFYRKKGIKLE